MTAWRAMRDVMAARGMPPDVLPPEPVPAETRRDSLLPVVQFIDRTSSRSSGLGPLSDTSGCPRGVGMSGWS